MFGLFGSPYGVKKLGAQFAHGMVQPPEQPPVEQPKRDGTKRAIGILGDFLLGLGGQQGVYGPRAYQERMLREQGEREARQAEAQRATAWEDWQRKIDYERANPVPRVNDTIEDFNWYKSLSVEDRAIYDQMRPVVIDGPDGRYVVPRSSLQGQSLAPTRPVGKLTPIGGPASAPGGFPR